jgi:hypothetical protein
MDKSIYTFSLGEKEITLKFTWGGIKKLKNILNADPFTQLRQSFDQTMDTVEFASNIIVAHSDLKKEEVDELLEAELPGKVIDVSAKVIGAWNLAFAIEGVGGETGKDTQQPKAA